MARYGNYKRVTLPYAGGNVPAGFQLKKNRTLKPSRRGIKRAAKFQTPLPITEYRRVRLPFAGVVPAGFHLKRNNTLKSSRRDIKRASQVGAVRMPMPKIGLGVGMLAVAGLGIWALNRPKREK